MITLIVISIFCYYQKLNILKYIYIKYNSTIFCISFSTDGHCVELTQPGSMVIKPGQPLTISCKVSYSVSSYYTNWIRQPAGKALEWIGYISSGGNTAYKDSLKTKFTMCKRHTVQQSYSRAVQKPSLFNITAEHALGSCVDNNMREVLVGSVKQSSKVRPDSCIL